MDHETRERYSNLVKLRGDRAGNDVELRVELMCF